MTFHDFEIGGTFFTAAGEWICTDRGTRVIVALKKRRLEEMPGGPPYAVLETVFDEADFGGCTREPWTQG